MAPERKIRGRARDLFSSVDERIDETNRLLGEILARLNCRGDEVSYTPPRGGTGQAPLSTVTGGITQVTLGRMEVIVPSIEMPIPNVTMPTPDFAGVNVLLYRILGALLKIIDLSEFTTRQRTALAVSTTQKEVPINPKTSLVVLVVEGADTQFDVDTDVTTDSMLIKDGGSMTFQPPRGTEEIRAKTTSGSGTLYVWALR